MTVGHPVRATVISGCVVVAAFLVQTAVLPALGAPPWMPVVWTVVATIACRVRSDLVYPVGFFAGLLLDASGAGPLGIGALIGVMVCVLAARVTMDRSPVSGVLRISVVVVLASVLQWLASAVSAPLQVPSVAALAGLVGSAVLLSMAALRVTHRRWPRP